MKILNLYAGCGGNRKLWSNEHEITSVEFNPEIAEIYKQLYPKDTVIVGDAHEYLLQNYEQFDFIWASPPCQSHSGTNHFLNAQGVKRYPDMKLYQEIILLQTFFKGKYVIENVKSYYTPLITPQISGRHYFWANFKIPNLEFKGQLGRFGPLKNGSRTEGKNLHKLGFDFSKINITESMKNKVLKNCVHPKIGKAILESAQAIYKANNSQQGTLFQ